MNSYEELLNEAAASDITVIENADFKSQSHGLIYGDIIGLNKNIQTDTERSCILAEELGHYYTSTGDIIDQTNVQNRKQEHRARMWAYDKLLPRIHPGAIVLLHSTSSTNAQILDELLGKWEEMGYQFRSLDYLVEQNEKNEA